MPSRRVWECKTRHPKHQFSVKVGTIFEDSPITLDKWLTAVWMLVNCKNGVSSYEIARDLKVTQKSAWFMLHRIRRALQSGSFRKLSGEVEVDESFIGGKARNMHGRRRARVITGTGGKDKATVLGMIERSGHVRTLVVENRRKKALQAAVREHVEAGTAIFTDELKSYDGLDAEYTHAVINHAVDTLTATPTQTRWKTFGPCSNVDCTALASALNRSICFDIWMNRRFVTTTARPLTRRDSTQH